MSIVGTRPPLISETNLYEPHHKVSRQVCMNQKWRRRCKLPLKNTVKHKTIKPPYSQLQTP